MSPDKKWKTLWHQSGVSKRGEGFVQLMLDDAVIIQLDVDEARDHARGLLEAAEAAEQDAFMMRFAQKNGMTLLEAGGMVRAFRAYREARGKKGPPSNADDFVVTDKHEKPPEKE